MHPIEITTDEIIKSMTDEQKALMVVNMRTLYCRLDEHEQSVIRVWYEESIDKLTKNNKYFGFA